MSSYAASPSQIPLLAETIGENFERTVRRFPDATALIDAPTGRSWTYAELDRQVNDVAAGLMARGIQAGDRVGIWSPNCAEWTIAQYATAKAGAILVNVNPAYRQAELDFVVKQSGMRMLLTAPSDQRNDYEAMARSALETGAGLETLVFLSGVGADSFEVLAAEGRETGEPGAAALAERMAGLQPGDPINIQYTSGTTGFPKGATLTHSNILNNGYFIGELLGYTEADRVVLPVPFYHCFGMVIGNLAALSHGAATIIPSRTFDAGRALAAVETYRGTSLYGVPTMFIAELGLPEFGRYDLSSLRTGVMAGSPCPEEIMKRVIGEMNMAEVAICYGMTETSPVSTMTRRGDSLVRRTRTVGRTMPHLESQVVDPGTGEQVPYGEIGELCTRGYSVMAGYWNQPEATAQAIDADGWMHTGDLARMDEEGYVSVEGRIKDMVIRGGENIYPREIEEFLYTHPSISDVQVIGVPDERYGEELMACIIPVPGAPEPDAAAIAEFCRDRLAHYKIPRYVQIRGSFPMTVSGKIRKVAMREEAVSGLAASGEPAAS
ncbi:AMP-binding protein [Arthrobacter sp. zg-Y859]|uniref:AMP-binding protein n=1 Tax=Arthrobacter jinronghuae TaxID=2964609 RepID=A0ABT1NNB0_9MICC|nr:AMP-binding protein [Arthrobacter jinronghuae]MCQ1949198.1 AMP-binding protein [Arthrobacter jinronghuae]MCQ1955358.1 AMP-binding protein [Arthrobacter jinronghuae]UWX78016.1 AMP-binding protein [Arthrobacter jinronghuae]